MTSQYKCIFLAVLSLIVLACGDDATSHGDGDHHARSDECIPDESLTQGDVSGQMSGELPMGRPQLPVGPNDALAQAACTLLDTAPMELIAVSDESSAGQVVVTPQPETAFSVRLPDSGIGYSTLEIPDWSVTISSSLTYQQSLMILDDNCDVEQTQRVSWNGACEESGLTEQRHLYHAWGSFTVRITGEATEPVRLSFIKLD